jgi:hypothetical protein
MCGLLCSPDHNDELEDGDLLYFPDRSGGDLEDREGSPPRSARCPPNFLTMEERTAWGRDGEMPC